MVRFRAIFGWNKETWAILISTVLLFTGYTTGFLYYGETTQQLPFRPKVWLGVFGCALLVEACLRFPRLLLCQLGVLTILFVRWVDAILFGAVVVDLDFSVVKEYGTALLVALCCLGVLKNTVVRQFATLWIGIITAAVLLLQLGYEWWKPGVFSQLSYSVAGRGGGWFGNPNTPALYLCQALGIIIACVPRVRIVALAAAFIGLGIVTTFSRAGFLCYGIMIVSYLFNRFRKNVISTSSVLGFLLLAFVPLFYVLSFGLDPGSDTNLNSRAQFMRGNWEAGLESDESRLILLKDCWPAIKRSPIVGYGAGTALGTYQPHNQILALWIDNGLVGLGYYLAVLFAFLYHCFRKDPLLLIAVTPVWAYIPFSTSLLQDKGIIFIMMVFPSLVVVRSARRGQLGDATKQLSHQQGQNSIV